MLILSRRLAEAAQSQAAAAAEAIRFGVADVAGFAEGCAGRARLRRALVTALEALPDGPRCERSLVAAKRAAASAQRRQRRVLAEELLDAPNAVLDLKVRTVLRRLETATEAWQQAVDCVAEVLGVKVG